MAVARLCESDSAGHKSPPCVTVSWGQTIPRQHGAWSVLLLGFLLGVGATGAVGVPALLLLISLVCAMPLRHVVGWWLRLSPNDARRQALLGWAAMYGALAVLAVAPLFWVYQLWLLLPMMVLAACAGVAQTLLERARLDRTLWGEMTGVLGLTVAAPAAAYASSGVLEPRAMAVWLLAALVFCAGVLHVRHVVRGGRGGDGGPSRARTGAVSVSFHMAALAVVAGMGRLGVIPTLTLLALVPATLRAIWAAVRPGGHKIPVRRLGLEELAYGVLFVLLAVLLLHS